MPSASEVDVRRRILDRVLALRTDLARAFLRGLRAAREPAPLRRRNALNRDDPAASARSVWWLPRHTT